MLRMLGDAQKRDIKATKILSIIVIFFIICWIPLYTINCIQAFCTDCQINATLTSFCIILSHLNSAVNPFLYAYHLRDFRISLKSYLQDKLKINVQHTSLYSSKNFGLSVTLNDYNHKIKYVNNCKQKFSREASNSERINIPMSMYSPIKRSVTTVAVSSTPCDENNHELWPNSRFKHCKNNVRISHDETTIISDAGKINFGYTKDNVFNLKFTSDDTFFAGTSFFEIDDNTHYAESDSNSLIKRLERSSKNYNINSSNNNKPISILKKQNNTTQPAGFLFLVEAEVCHEKSPRSGNKNSNNNISGTARKLNHTLDKSENKLSTSLNEINNDISYIKLSTSCPVNNNGCYMKTRHSF